jgi:hypothetical protein
MGGTHRKHLCPIVHPPVSRPFAHFVGTPLTPHTLKKPQASLILGDFLKFLIIGQGIDYVDPIDPASYILYSEKIILPAVETAKEWEEKKLVVGGFFAGQKAGAMIIEAASGEELSGLIQKLSFWSENALEIIPLQSFQSGAENVKQQIANAKKMMEAPMPKEKYESAPI